MSTIEVNGKLVPAVVDIPTHEDTNGLGGYRSVPTSGDRNDIPSGYLKDGMVVHVQDTDREFKWNGVTWTPFQLEKVNLSALSDEYALYYDEGEEEWVSGKLPTGAIEDQAITNAKIAPSAITLDELHGDVFTTPNGLYTRGEADATFVTDDDLGIYMTIPTSGASEIPSAVGAPGDFGDLVIDNSSPDYLYVCIATDTWRRVALSTF